MQSQGLFTFTFVVSIVCEQRNLTEYDELDKLVENYDRRVRPNAGGIPVNLTLSVHVLNIPKIKFGQHGMEMTIEMYFRQFWEDPRLKLDNSLNLSKILGEKEILDKIWVPHLFFSNEHSSQVKESFVSITDGELKWVQRMQVTFTTIPGEYRRFPFDYQKFILDVGSFWYTAADIRLSWKEGNQSVTLGWGLGATDLQIVGHRQKELFVGPTKYGNHSLVFIEIDVERRSGFYFSILFVPLFLITMISIATLWIDIKERIRFILMLNLFIIGFKVWFRVSMLPPVSYSVCAIEYIDMCLTITLLVLIECIVITSLRSSNPARGNCNEELENINMDEESNIQVMKQHSTHPECRYFGIYVDTNRIEDICKFLIPLSFVMFQVCFWIHANPLENQNHQLEETIGYED